jgi:succinyl-diaminopimelate desuccinylase
LNAVRIRGGVAGNVIPNEAIVTVNYRFAPDRDEAQALAHLHDVFDGYELVVTDSAPGARPGLDQPLVADFAAAIGGTPRAKFGWTDVSRFSALGIPAVNYGPGDPGVAHSAHEHVAVEQLRDIERKLLQWLR